MRNFDLFIKYRNIIPENLRKYINRARLFLFNIYPIEAFDMIPYSELQDLCYNFCLPFPVVAVEDKTSCVIMWDEEKDAVGLNCKRHMLEISDMKSYLNDNSSIDKKNQNLFIQKYKEKFGEYPIILKYGNGIVDWEGGRSDGKNWKADIQMDVYIEYFPSSGYILDKLKYPEFFNLVKKDFARAMISAYEELLSMSRRSHFILETKPKPKGKAKKKVKYFKSEDRPTYTVVKPSKARGVMGVKNNDSSILKNKIEERRAYIRREHDRILRSDKFTKKQGQTVKVKRTYVPAIWNGESKSEDERHFYKVILDMPKGVVDSCS